MIESLSYAFQQSWLKEGQFRINFGINPITGHMPTRRWRRKQISRMIPLDECLCGKFIRLISLFLTMPVTVLKHCLNFSTQNFRYHSFFCNLNLLVCMTVPVIPVLEHYTSQIESDWSNEKQDFQSNGITNNYNSIWADLIKHPSRSRTRDLERRLRRRVWNRDQVIEMTRPFRRHWACQTLFWLLSDKVQGGPRQIWWWSDVTLKTPLITNFDRFSVSLSVGTHYSSPNGCIKQIFFSFLQRSQTTEQLPSDNHLQK